MKDFKTQIDEILQKVSIIDVINNYVELKKSGKNYFGLCPFHDDTNPSMSVSEDKKIFKCFSCGETGNAITFVQKLKIFPLCKLCKKSLKQLELILMFRKTLKNKLTESTTKLCIKRLNFTNLFFITKRWSKCFKIFV